MNNTDNYRNYILCIIFFIAGVGVQLLIGLTVTTSKEKRSYELGYGKALDTIKTIMDQATKKEDQLKAITVIDLQDADTIYSYTLRRLDNKKFKK